VATGKLKVAIDLFGRDRTALSIESPSRIPAIADAGVIIPMARRLGWDAHIGLNISN
jgi:hypothetical protein